MDNNTYYIKLSGKANIPLPLSIGHNFTVVSDMSITGENKTDNEDGTFSITWKAEPVTCEIAKSNGEKIKAKDTRSESTLTRSLIWKRWVNSASPYEFDTLYKQCQNVIRSHIDNIIDEAITRIENDK
jgi:hypothetical protein